MHLRPAVSSVAALGIFALSALAGGTVLAEGEPAVVEGPRVHWDYSSTGRPRPITEYLSRFAEFIDTRTGGRFTMEIHPGTLSKPRANLDGLMIGAFHGASFCAAYYPGKLPAHTGLDLPFLPISGPRHLQYVTHKYFEHPILREETGNWNARFFMSSLLPLYEVVGKGDPPSGLDDWKGIRIRALGQQGKAMEKLGAVPTNMTASDAYGALDRGLLDAVSFPYYAHKSYGIWELSDWFTSGLAVSSIACGALFNNDAYNELPDQYKALIDEYVESDVGYARQIEVVREAEAEALPFFRSAGLTEVIIDPEERAAFSEAAGRPIWDAWAEEMDEHGYDGQELLNLILQAAREYSEAPGS